MFEAAMVGNSHQKDENQHTRKLGVNVLEIGLQFGVIIAVPLVLLICLGLYLDKTFNTIPLFILLGLFTALGISTYGLYRRISEIQDTLNNKPK